MNSLYILLEKIKIKIKIIQFKENTKIFENKFLKKIY